MEDNVKGLIRTCCIVLVISVGLSVVYSAKRPYIYLIENYEFFPPPPTPIEHPQHHQHHHETRTIRTRGGGGGGHHHHYPGPSGNNYVQKFYYPFLFQGINRNGEVTQDSRRRGAAAPAFIESPEPLISPPTVKRTNYFVSGGRNNDDEKYEVREEGVKEVGKYEEDFSAFTATTVSPLGETWGFPIPWEWKARMEETKKVKKTKVKGEDKKNKKTMQSKTEDIKKGTKEEEQKDLNENLNTEDRKFRLPRLPTLPPFPSIDFQFETADPGRKSRSHNPSRSQTTSPKQIKFTDIISPETLSFITKLQALNVTKLAANAGSSGIIKLDAANVGGSDELTLTQTGGSSAGSPLLSGDFLNFESSKPLIIPKDTTNNRPSAAEIEAYHKLKNKFNKPATSKNRDSEEDDEQEEVEDDEAEDDTSAADVEGSQQQSDEDQEIGSKSKESKEDEQEQDQAEADSKEPSKEEEQEQEQDQPSSTSNEDDKDQDQEQEQEAGSKEEQPSSDEEALDTSDDEEALNDAPSVTRTKKKKRRPIKRPSDTYALTSLPPNLQSYSYTRPKPNNNTAQYQHDNLFESANIQPESSEHSAKPVIILVNVPKPSGLKGDTGLYEDDDYLYGDEDKKAEKKAKKAEKKKKIKEKKKKKKEKKKKKKEKKKKKKAWPKKKKKKKAWGPPTTKKPGWGQPTTPGWGESTTRPNKKADIINRLTKIHSNFGEIVQTFKGVISDYVINRPHVGVEFIHTNRNQPPPHRRPPPPKKGDGEGDDDDDDDDEDWKKEKSGEDGEDEWKEKSGEGEDTEHEQQKSDDRKLRLTNSGSYEHYMQESHFVAVPGKPTLWNPTQWSFSYTSPGADTESAAGSLSKRLQECQKRGKLADCASYVVDSDQAKYDPPEPIYVESVISNESGERPPRPPFREPSPIITKGSSEKVWVKTWDKEHTGLPMPIESTELNKNG